MGKLMLPLAACLFGGAVYARVPFLWAVGLSPGEPPRELSPEHRPKAAPKAAMSCTGGQWVQVGQSYYDGFCATYLQDNGCTHCVTTAPPILPP